MEKTQKDRGGDGELTMKDYGGAEQAEAAWSLAQRTARRRHGQRGGGDDDDGDGNGERKRRKI